VELAMQAVRLLTSTACVLALAAPMAAAQERPKREPATDRTVPVTRGARLAINNFAGEVVIRTWEKDSLRVQAAHSSRVTIDIQTTPTTIAVRARGSGGPQGGVDYEITAPTWLPVKVSGQFLYVGIEGAQNEVSAETVRGDIVVKGGSGFVTAKSIEGEVIVEDAKGRIVASSVNEGIRITGSSGEISAETTNGDIVLTKVDARSVQVATVNGDLRYEGSVVSGGQYRFATHNGDITMVLPENTNATFTVRTYNGDFHSNLPVKSAGDIRRGRRATYVLGNGGAEIELESFGGTIRVRRPGTAPARGREKELEQDHARDHVEDRSDDSAVDHSARSATIGSTCAARTAGAAAAATAVKVKSKAVVANVHGSVGRI
jgi:DUF4097 and DUF4098 domain-containing protein YvlB